MATYITISFPHRHVKCINNRNCREEQLQSLIQKDLAIIHLLRTQKKTNVVTSTEVQSNGTKSDLCELYINVGLTYIGSLELQQRHI